jgi:hypothetical protein
MMLKKLLVCALLFLIVFSCKKNETPAYINAAAYYPLQNGRVWFYRLDSTTIPPFGTELIVHSYHLKDSAGISFLDNTGRESWPIYRFITDTLEQNAWQNISTYYVTPTANDVEVVDDNNLRFIKLISPVEQGKDWMGNSYIDTRSSTSLFQYLDGWDYMYDSVNMPYNTLAGTIDSTITVLQRDETSPPGDFDPQFYQQRNYSVEVYAYNVGLIYKNFLHWTWQPTPPPASYQDDSYGIILNLLRIKQ